MHKYIYARQLNVFNWEKYKIYIVHKEELSFKRLFMSSFTHFTHLPHRTKTLNHDPEIKVSIWSAKQILFCFMQTDLLDMAEPQSQQSISYHGLQLGSTGSALYEIYFFSFFCQQDILVVFRYCWVSNVCQFVGYGLSPVWGFLTQAQISITFPNSLCILEGILSYTISYFISFWISIIYFPRWYFCHGFSSYISELVCFLSPLVLGGSDPTFVMQCLLFSYYCICNPASDMCSLLFPSINVLCQLSTKPKFFLFYSKKYRYCIQTEQKTKHRTFYYIIIQCFQAFGSVT